MHADIWFHRTGCAQNVGMKSSTLPLSLSVAVAAGLWPSLGQAVDLSGLPSLRLNGFGTVALSHVDGPEGWGLRRDLGYRENQGGSQLRTDSRIGVQANYEITPQWQATAQVLARDRLPQVKPSDSVEWAFLAYQPNDAVTLRAGRMALDVFMMSDQRNVGFAYPWVRPNLEFYGGLPLYGFDGMDAAYEWSRGDARWRVKAAYGDTHTWTPIQPGAPAVEAHLHNGISAVLSREEDGLTVRAAVSVSNIEVNSPASLTQVVQALQSVESVGSPEVAQQANALLTPMAKLSGRVHFAELGVVYDRGPWLIQAEAARIFSDLYSLNAKAAYLAVGRRMADYTVYGVLGWVRPDNKAAERPDWSALGGAAMALGAEASNGLNAGRTRERSVSMGVRWDFHPQAALKVQWDWYDVDDNGAALWSGRDVRGGHPQVGTVALDFVF